MSAMRGNGVIIIPAYEPDEKLIILLRNLYEASDADLIIVNDGSGREADFIFEEAENYGTVLKHDKNCGKGRAVKTALEYIKVQEKHGAVAIADADGQHEVSDILSLLKEASLNKEALITGSRIFSNDIPLRSRMGNQVTRVTFWLLSGKRMKDTQTGLRAFDSNLIPTMLSVSGERYEYETNVLLMCVKTGIDIVEIPIETIYIDGNKSSHFHVLRDSAKIYMNMFKFASSSFLSFCVDYIGYGLMLYVTTALSLPYAAAASNISSRIVSASFNYHLNRKYVFRSKEDGLKSAVRYGILAAFILLVNTVFLLWLTKDAGMNAWAAKLIVEISMFIMSFLVQKFFIFKRTNFA